MGFNKIFYFLIKHRNNPLLGKLFTSLLKLLGLELPQSVILGKNVIFPHLGGNIVIHPDTIIGDNVNIYHGVTIGRADAHISREISKLKNIIIEDNVNLFAGAKILGKEDNLIVRSGTIVGANSVLLTSTQPNEIWVGIPAKKIGAR
ncbi:hypothetical protein [Macrococcoides caseolyticum]|uniref:Serine acetyltransferase n=1 Tax=Macrococcoides caseolyticum TaxID=69966 RepID=A0A855GGE3_9STAP|nr:hypothetical protein [Macrococcus caseolyticus]PKE12567.1 hypothetical protein CW685_03380 [Macrococcus caseolyticus]PKE26391.1 hypothetical protein CW686_05380 [Macrococcus caseolyticus]PKE48968.1 hypothetical protein CW677_02125 [Macrococcus caseolyticus]PKE58905.1 hypothetical protein CW673_05500 [Macrococcus caseolyticus]PKE69871.1 hypothetical protein CW662_07000 [Macrococcus caseolyticus]